MVIGEVYVFYHQNYLNKWHIVINLPFNFLSELYLKIKQTFKNTAKSKQKYIQLYLKIMKVI